MATRTVVDNRTNPDGTVTAIYSDGSTEIYRGQSLVSTTPAGSFDFGTLTPYAPPGTTTKTVTDPATGKPLTIVIKADGSLFQSDTATHYYSQQKDAAAPNQGVQSAGPTAVTNLDTGLVTTARGTSPFLNNVSKALPYAGAGAGLLLSGGNPAAAYAGYKLGGAVQTAADNRDGANGAAAAAAASGIPGAHAGPSTDGGTGGGPVSTSYFDQSYASGLVNEANSAAPRTAPTISAAPAIQRQSAPAPVTATQVQAPQSDFRAGLVAGTVAAPGNITPQQVTAERATAGQARQGVGNVAATTFDAPQNTFKAGVTAGVVGSPGTVTADKIAAPDTVKAQVIGPQKLDTTNSDQSRAEFQDALAKIKIAAEGGSPSAAEWLLQKGIDENVGTAYGLAASLQGRNPGQALHVGAVTAKDAIAKSAADMAALRASEQATARHDYGTFAQGLNASDIQQAGIQLGADVDVAKANQATGLQGDIANQIAKLDASKTQAANDLQAQITNVGNELTRLTGNRDAALKAGLQNQADQLTATIENQRARLATLQSNQAALLDAAKATAANATTIETVNAQLRTTTAIANQTAALDASKTNAANNLQAQIQNVLNQINVAVGNRDAALKAGEANLAADTNITIANLNAQKDTLLANQAALLDAAKATASNTVALAGVNANVDIANSKNATDVAIAQAEAQLKQQGLDDTKIYQLKQLGLDAMKAAAADARTGQQIDVQRYAADQAYKAALIQGGATVAGAAIPYLYKMASGLFTSDKSKSADGITYGPNGSPILD